MLSCRKVSCISFPSQKHSLFLVATLWSCAADQRSLMISGNETKPHFCYKSNLPLLLEELALFFCLRPSAQVISFNKKLCLPKNLVEAIFNSMILLSKNLERARWQEVPLKISVDNSLSRRDGAWCSQQHSSLIQWLFLVIPIPLRYLVPQQGSPVWHIGQQALLVNHSNVWKPGTWLWSTQPRWVYLLVI